MAARGVETLALRPDEAGRALRYAHRQAPSRRRAAAPGQCARHAVEHGRLPDQAEAWRADAHLPHDPGPGERAASRGSAACTATPSSTRRRCSTAQLRLKARPSLRFAGQITGVEGYVESAAIGLLAGRFAQRSRANIAAAADHRVRRAARAHHRRRGCKDVPADEREFRPVSGAQRRTRQGPQEGDVAPRARRSRCVARRKREAAE